jgi:hypothetical protein
MGGDGRKTSRPGGSTLQSSDDDGAAIATPGKQTLVQRSADAATPQAAPPLSGGDGLDNGISKIEGSTFYPAKPTAYAGAVQELTDAATRWDAQAGNTKANLVK